MALIGPTSRHTSDFVYGQQFKDVPYGVDFINTTTTPFYIYGPMYLDQKIHGPEGHSIGHSEEHSDALRPRITWATENVYPPPTAAEGFRVSAEVQPGVDHIADVTLYFRVGLGGSTHAISMDGQRGYYSAHLHDGLQGVQFSPGELVRWYISVTDVRRRSARAPEFQTFDAPEFFGTAMADPSYNKTGNVQVSRI